MLPPQIGAPALTPTDGSYFGKVYTYGGGDVYVRTSQYSAKPSSGYQYLAVDYRVLVTGAPDSFSYQIKAATKSSEYAQYGNSLVGGGDTGWQTVAFDVGSVSDGIKLHFYGDYMGSPPGGSHIHLHLDYGRWTNDDGTFQSDYVVASPMD